MHLYRHGFKEGYETWTEHGEELISHDGYDGVGNRESTHEVDQMDQMLVDLAGHHPPILDAEPIAYDKAFLGWLLVQMSWCMIEPHTHACLLLLICLM
jgi:hypothetical protein